MTRLLLVVCMFLSNFASASDYITVTGSGKTFEEAKHQAFRKAIEFKVGAIVLSDVETKKSQRVKDDIYVYSAGYVDDFKILYQSTSNTGITLNLEVLVSESKIKNRVLTESKSSQEFDGSRHGAQIHTLINERRSSDTLLNKVLSRFPSNALIVKQFGYTITLDHRREPIITIPYEILWNYEFIKTLRDTTEVISNCKSSWNKPCYSVVTIMVKDTTDILLGTKTDHYFNDSTTTDQIHNHLVMNSPRIVVRFFDINGTYIYGSCHAPRFIWGGNEGFYSMGRPNQVVIFGNVREKGDMRLRLPVYIAERTTNIQISLESENVCLK